MKSINRSGGRRSRLDDALDRAKQSPTAQPSDPFAVDAAPEAPIEPGPAARPTVAPSPVAPPAGDEAVAPTRPTPVVQATKVGIVFVHGIGTQVPCETLVSWSAPIVEAVGAWAAANPGRVGPTERDDLVVRSTIDFVGDTLSLVELEVPAALDPDGVETHPAQRWVMTEAWWASSVAAPPLSVILDWSTRQGVLGRVVRGIVSNSAGTGGGTTRFWAAFGLTSFLSITSSLSVFAYSIVRTVGALIPIKELQDAAVFTAFEGFLMRWWGDVYVLLRDPVQSSNVRQVIADAATALRADGCDSVVILAHSGGTVASYMTLDDPVHGLLDAADDPASIPDRARVTKLITHGQAISLVRSLPAGTYETAATAAAFDRIQPPLAWTGRWVDFWATHDPAPSGPLGPETSAPRPGFETRMVWNRRSLREDHGGYLGNDEEFLLPLLRELDTPDATPDHSRFPVPTCEAVDARRQRVLTLTMWRRFAFVAPLVAFLVAVRGGLGTSGIGELLELARVAWTYVPGNQVVGQVVAVIASFGDLVRWSALIGLGALIAIALALSVHAAFPVRRSRVWRDHPWTFATVVFLDWVPAATILAIVGVPLVVGVVASVLDAQVTTSLILLLGIALFSLAVGLTKHADDVARGRGWKYGDVLAGLATMLILLPVVVLTVLAVVADDTVRTLVVGAAIAFVAFRPLVGYGSGRWERWDRAERAAVRRAAPRPGRRGRALEAIALVVIGVVLSMGLVGWTVGSMSLLWVALGALVIYAVVASATDSAVVEG